MRDGIYLQVIYTVYIVLHTDYHIFLNEGHQITSLASQQMHTEIRMKSSSTCHIPNPSRS